ncbi:hypothetical protein DFJ73DRAFT_760869 [Zopfochytrium polystomum]|nr:hypothetical protein DFJ73DRAFT_760869 [Zopfochytrium polystomum]
MANATSAKVVQTTNWNQQKVLGGRMRSSTEDGGGAAQVPKSIQFRSVVMAQLNLCADPEPSRGAAVIAISPLKEKVLRPASGREWGALGESRTHDLRMTVWRSTCATSGTWLEDSPHATQSACKFYRLTVKIPPFHGGDRGSIPRLGAISWTSLAGQSFHFQAQTPVLDWLGVHLTATGCFFSAKSLQIVSKLNTPSRKPVDVNEQTGKYFTRHAPWILTQVPALEAGNVKPPLNQSHLDLLHALSGIGVRISYFSWQTMERGAPGQSLWRTGRDKVWGLTAGCEEAALCAAAIKQDAIVLWQMQWQSSSDAATEILLELTGMLSMSSNFWTPLSPLPLKNSQTDKKHKHT